MKYYSMESMKIHQIFFKNSLRNFSYLITFDDGAIYCIDPTQSVEVIESLQLRSLSGIINTHDHCDHYQGNVELVLAYKCPVMAHKSAEVPCLSRKLLDHEIIHQSIEQGITWVLRAIYTPGHTMSHICVLLEKDGLPHSLFTGDCFFNAGVGNCHNGGDPEILFESIDSIFTHLPDDLLIYPGHEYLKRNLEFTNHFEPQNIKAQEFLNKIADLNLDNIFFINSMKTEREINTFLRLDSADLVHHLNAENSKKKNIFLTLRKLRNTW